MAEGESSYEADTRLVERCLDGEKNAWVELVDKYRRLIYSIPVRMGLPTEQADEVFQDVCLKLLTRLDTLKDGRSLTRWLVVTTQRRCWDLSSHERRYKLADDDDEAIGEDVDHRPRGDELLIEAERAEQVRRAVEKLSDTCRQVVEALFYRDPPLSYKELAAEMGRPHGSLGPTRLRCLESLRTVLTEEDEW